MSDFFNVIAAIVRSNIVNFLLYHTYFVIRSLCNESEESTTCNKISKSFEAQPLTPERNK